jgi:hypothetical protein
VVNSRFGIAEEKMSELEDTVIETKTKQRENRLENKTKIKGEH